MIELYINGESVSDWIGGPILVFLFVIVPIFLYIKYGKRVARWMYQRRVERFVNTMMDGQSNFQEAARAAYEKRMRGQN